MALQPSLRESYGRNSGTFYSVSETHFKKFNDATNNFTADGLMTLLVEVESILNCLVL